MTDNSVTEKACTKCGHTKPLNEFYRDRSRPDGKTYSCKLCQDTRRIEREAIQRGDRPKQNYIKGTLAERFWPKVRQGTPDECWEWQAGRYKKGYGCVWNGTRMEQASRVAWKLTHGEIPEGLEVCHKCDNPPCCNPSHLFVDTHTENVRDSFRKGRHDVRGTRNARALLTPEQVIAVRRGVAAGDTRAKWARELGVSHGTICMIVNGKNWRHI